MNTSLFIKILCPPCKRRTASPRTSLLFTAQGNVRFRGGVPRKNGRRTGSQHRRATASCTLHTRLSSICELIVTYAFGESNKNKQIVKNIFRQSSYSVVVYCCTALITHCRNKVKREQKSGRSAPALADVTESSVFFFLGTIEQQLVPVRPVAQAFVHARNGRGRDADLL